MITLRRSQRTELHAHGVLPLSGSVLSPYFQIVASTRKGYPGRDTNLSLTYMDFLIDGWGASGGNPYLIVSWWDSSNTFQNSSVVFMTFADVRANGLANAAIAAINAYAVANSLTVASIKGLLDAPLIGSPKAAIADAPADAVTNYNVVTTLLGTLTSAVNTANAKQNQIATQLNTLLAELRSLNIIST